jgi:hypothetical protein
MPWFKSRDFWRSFDRVLPCPSPSRRLKFYSGKKLGISGLFTLVFYSGNPGDSGKKCGDSGPSSGVCLGLFDFSSALLLCLLWLVPRVSMSVVTTWSWQICVEVLGSDFGTKVEFLEKNFYRLLFTPPSLVAQFGPSIGIKAGSGSSLTLASLRSKDDILGTWFGSSALWWEELLDVEEADDGVPPRKGSDPLGRYDEHNLCSSD